MSMYKIDTYNLFEKLGIDKLKELATTFYNRIYEDDNKEFLAMFPPNKEMAIQNHYEFFTQRLGGPSLYSDRKGHPALRRRHKSFPITQEFADHWLGIMKWAMEEVEIPREYFQDIYDYIEDTANFLVNIKEDGTRVY